MHNILKQLLVSSDLFLTYHILCSQISSCLFLLEQPCLWASVVQQLAFIGGVCQYLAGRNHDNSSWPENAACLLLLPVCTGHHTYHGHLCKAPCDPLARYPCLTEQMPVHHQSITHCKVACAHTTYTHVNMRASWPNTHVGYILQHVDLYSGIGFLLRSHCIL